MIHHKCITDDISKALTQTLVDGIRARLVRISGSKIGVPRRDARHAQ
jgi:hypothetical protein